MLRFDLNISILLKEIPFLERFARVSQLGFGAVEFWWPAGESLAAIAEQLHSNGLNVALINFDAGNMAAGERGFLNNPDKREWFRSHVPVAIEFAAQIGCPQLNALVGNVLPGVSREAQLECVCENLAWVAYYAATAGLGVVVETLNTFENPRYLSRRLIWIPLISSIMRLLLDSLWNLLAGTIMRKAVMTKSRCVRTAPPSSVSDCVHTYSGM
jgi:hydroxypyruvate isomerase